MRIDLGLPVECADGPCGTLGDVVVNPVQGIGTHVVVEPHHDHHLARLVPIWAVDPQAGGMPVKLRCKRAELERYPDVEEIDLVTLDEWPPLQDEQWEVGVSRVLALPFYDSAGLDAGLYGAMPWSEGAYLSYDRIPAGEVELRARSPVAAVDGGTIGHVNGFVLDGDGRITHLVVERGRLWRRRQVTIPVGAVKHLRTDRVELELTGDEVAGLPSVPVHRHSP